MFYSSLNMIEQLLDCPLAVCVCAFLAAEYLTDTIPVLLRAYPGSIIGRCSVNISIFFQNRGPSQVPHKHDS
jgi:hypothetical protein